MAKSTAVTTPNLGLYYDRPSIALDSRMLQDGLNFRIKQGKISNLNLGWTRFSTFTLNGPVTLISNFFLRSGAEQLIFGTPTDLYVYVSTGLGSVKYLTPRYQTGTASASGTAVTGTLTDWSPAVKAGDEIHFGAADYVDPTGTWYTIASVTNDLALVLTASAGTVTNGPYTIRQRFSGSLATVWSTDTFINAAPSNEDEWYATNGLEYPVRWNGTSTQVEVLSSLNFKAKQLRVYSNMMLYFNLDQGGAQKPTDMINSDIGQPSVVSGGLSEQFKVHSGSDAILHTEKIGDAIAIYSEDSITLAQFVGDPLVFVFRTVVTGNGPVSSKAVAQFGDFHEFIGHDSQYVFDGATVRVSGSHVWREFLRQQDPTRIANTFHHFDEENGDLLWVVPFTSDPNSGTASAPPAKAVVEHYLEEVGDKRAKPVSLRSFPFTATGYFQRETGITWDQLTAAWQTYNFRWNDQFFSASFPFNMAGSATGKIYSFNTSQDADGATLASYITFGRKAVVDGKNRGLVSRIYPFVTSFANTLKVTVGMSDHALGPATITHTDLFDQTLPEGRFFVNPFRRGRYVDITFGTDGPGQPYELSGYDIDLKTGGNR